MKKKKRGFTLVELIVTIALLAIAGTVIAINMVSLNKQQQAKEKTRIESAIKAAAEAYVNKENIALNQGLCISVESLIEQGYIKESEVSDYKDQAVSVTISSDGKIYNISEDSNCRQTNNLKIYTLKYNANGGSNAPSSTQTNGQSFDVTISSKTPTRNGYVFIGWSKSKSATSASFSPGSTITLNENTTLYAVWTVDKYTLAYDKNTTDEVSNLPLIQTAGYAEDINISEIIPQRIGYSFIAWNTKADLSGENYNPESIYTITENSTLYANWQANSYTVTFDANGGSVTPSTKVVTYDSTYGDLPTPSKAGYTFDGWYTTSSGESKIESTTQVKTSNDHTLYALWQANNYTITFDSSCGNVTSSSKSVTYDSTYGSLPMPSKTGYTFNGWYTTSSGGTQITNNTTVKITSDQTLYARCSADSLKVTFDANGGSVSPASKSVTYDSKYGTLPIPTREDYTFDGWYTSANGGSKVTSSTKVTQNQDHYLYAHWKPNVTIKVTNGTIKSVTNMIFVSSRNSSDQTYTISKGGNTTIKFTPNNDYILDSVSCNGTYGNMSFNESNDSLNITNVTSSLTCNVEYRSKEVNLEILLPAFFDYNLASIVDYYPEFSEDNIELDGNYYHITIPIDPSEKIDLGTISVWSDTYKSYTDGKYYSMFALDSTGVLDSGISYKNDSGVINGGVCKVIGNSEEYDKTTIDISIPAITSPEESTLVCDLKDAYFAYIVQYGYAGHVTGPEDTTILYEQDRIDGGEALSGKFFPYDLSGGTQDISEYSLRSITFSSTIGLFKASTTNVNEYINVTTSYEDTLNMSLKKEILPTSYTYNVKTKWLNSTYPIGKGGRIYIGKADTGGILTVYSTTKLHGNSEVGYISSFGDYEYLGTTTAKVYGRDMPIYAYAIPMLYGQGGGDIYINYGRACSDCENWWDTKGINDAFESYSVDNPKGNNNERLYMFGAYKGGDHEIYLIQSEHSAPGGDDDYIYVPEFDEDGDWIQND